METRISKDLEENTSLWHKCTGCQEFGFKNELERNLYICSYCGALFPLLAEKRLEYLLDDLPTTETISAKESGLIAEGMISGHPVCLFIADIDVIPAELNASFFLTAIENCLTKTDSIDYDYRVSTDRTASSFGGNHLLNDADGAISRYTTSPYHCFN